MQTNLEERAKGTDRARHTEEFKRSAVKHWVRAANLLVRWRRSLGFTNGTCAIGDSSLDPLRKRQRIHSQKVRRSCGPRTGAYVRSWPG